MIIYSWDEPFYDKARKLGLSHCEAKYLALVAQGVPHKQIAAERNIKEGSVNTTLCWAYDKLGVRSAPAAVAVVYESMITEIKGEQNEKARHCFDPAVSL